MVLNLGLIGREAVRVAATPMTVAYGPADHAYEVAASAEGPVGRGGRSRPIASFGLFHGVLLCAKGLGKFCHSVESVCMSVCVWFPLYILGPDGLELQKPLSKGHLQLNRTAIDRGDDKCVKRAIGTINQTQ